MFIMIPCVNAKCTQPKIVYIMENVTSEDVDTLKNPESDKTNNILILGFRENSAAIDI